MSAVIAARAADRAAQAAQDALALIQAGRDGEAVPLLDEVERNARRARMLLIGRQPPAELTTSREYGVGDLVERDGRTVVTSVLPLDTIRDAVEHAASFGGTVAGRTVTVTPWVPVDPTERGEVRS